MKLLTLLFATGFGLVANTHAAEASKPLLQLTVKKQVLDTDHQKLGGKARTKEKTLTLQVVIVNTSPTVVEESVLTGIALVSRAGEFKKHIAKESLGELKVPAMKPNAKLTFDLGKIQLSEVEWANQKFEENLEEWQVTCRHGEVEIGKAESSAKYATVAKEAETSGPQRPGPGNGGGPLGPRRFRP